MRCFPIIPWWLMTIICLLLIVFVIIKNKSITQILMIIILFIINLRIMLPNDKAEVLTTNLDVILAIDNTISMNTEDYNNDTRLSAVKKDCLYIIDELKGSKISIITFDNLPNIITPFTTDLNLTTEAIEMLNPIDAYYAKGTALNVPLETILKQLKFASKNEDRVKILFFISDGEITDESTLESYSELSKYINNGAVLGYGTQNGAKIKAESKVYTDQTYLKYNGEYAISKIDENNLKQIAKDMNIDYIHMTDKKDIDNKIKEIKKGIVNNNEISNKNNYTDIYYVFIIPLIILIIIEFDKYRRCSL